ncbi:DUF1640 domain-containing protein [uncultured Gammaproteobacteria bacterium]
MSIAVPFDTLALVKELENAGFSSAQAEAQAKALSGVLQKVEESRMQELATKGDVKAAVEVAKVDIIKWVVTTGMVILGGMAAINRLVPPPAPVYYQSATQELRPPAPLPAPSPAFPVPSTPPSAPTH